MEQKRKDFADTLTSINTCLRVQIITTIALVIILAVLYFKNTRRKEDPTPDESEAEIKKCNVDGLSPEFNEEMTETDESITTNENSSTTEISSAILLETLKLFPSELHYFLKQHKLLSEIYDDSKKIVKRMREMADHIEKTHNDVLIADRVGTGVGITSGVLTIAGLIATPFTGGISLGLTIAGTTTAVLGSATSAGANFADYVITRYYLSQLEPELKEFQNKLDTARLIYNEDFVTKVCQCRQKLEEFSKLPQYDFLLMIITAQEIVSKAIKGKIPFENAKAIKKIVKPVAYKFLKQLSHDLNPAQLHNMAANMSVIMKNISSLHDLIRTFVQYSHTIEYETRSKIQASLYSTARSVIGAASAFIIVTSAIGPDSIEVSAAGSHLGNMRGVLAAAFIVVDIVRMVQICKETGETPTVQQLRFKADSLEKDMAPDSE